MGLYSDLVKSNEPRAKKRFGQHFLRDTGILDRISRLIHPEESDFFLEIGAGDGALSTRLTGHAARFIAVEIDIDRIDLLRQSLAPFDNAEIVQADILAIDLEHLVFPHFKPGHRLRIVGNLPYNIATAIIEKALRAPIPVADMHFMVQLEVAQRIAAEPGTREYGYFSVYCRRHADVNIEFTVSPACFVPRPKVYSAMISLHPKAMRTESGVEPVFVTLCKAAFAYRRKTIENSLGRHPVIGKIARALLERAGIDGTLRAESLSVRDYEILAEIAFNEFSLSS
ncbi:MAG TPA: 16S rRNA (adenine(1518)-N(6)/adenine(1519)-N(6))-dimethyltransferase RsmA [Acidobacteriota bacterium]|nr:16S rRNA (adenine(1518)-N(6)/adenine(1519)-N(6))-dimethyltransferase RsmA [Acidobacteriota bacterium]